MNPDEFRDLLTKQPFVPMRLHMGNGRTLEVRHPEFATAGGELAAISEVNADGKTSLRVVSLININEVEFLPSEVS